MNLPQGRIPWYVLLLIWFFLIIDHAWWLTVYLYFCFVDLFLLSWWAFSSVVLFGWERCYGRAFLLGLPALLAGSSAAAFFGAVLFTPDSATATSYQKYAQVALSDRDYRLARLCFARLSTTEDIDRSALLSEAECYLAMGDSISARGILDYLAPRDQEGYGPAHFVLAQQLLRDSPSVEQQRDAEMHLRRALIGSARQIEIHALLSRLLFEQGRLEAAEPHLVVAAANYPELTLPLATLHLRRGNLEQAHYEAAKARDVFEAKTLANPDDSQARLAWAQSMVILEKYENASSILREGLARTSLTTYRSVLAAVHATWSEAVARKAPTDLPTRMRILETGLHYEPDNVQVLQSYLTLLTFGGQQADAARTTLRRLLAEGKGSATLCFVLGTDCSMRGELAEGQALFEQAVRQAPQFAALANNLAWVLSQGTSNDLPRALALANLAVDKVPRNPHFRDTRGRVFMRLGRWSDALQDMLLAHQALPPSASMHEALLEIYTKLGMSELAKDHKKLLAEIKSPSH